MLRGRCQTCLRPIRWRTGQGWEHVAQRVEHVPTPVPVSDTHLLFNPTRILRETEPPGPDLPDEPPF